MTNRPAAFDAYSLVHLVTPESPADYPGARLDEIQEEHLGYLNELLASGAMLAAGPLRDQPDERLRGICLFAVGLDEAKALMERDPAVRAGRLAVEGMTWLTPQGQLAFPQAPESDGPPQ